MKNKINKLWQPIDIRNRIFYVISEILNVDVENLQASEDIIDRLLDYKDDIFSCLEINQFIWNHYDCERAFLRSIEENYWIDCDEQAQQNFSAIANATPIFSTIESLELQIKQQVGELFTFNSILPLNNPLNKNEISIKIVNFYNFLINSRIIPQEHLLQLILYLIDRDDESVSEVDGCTSYYMWNQRVLMAIFLRKGWCSKPRKSLRSYLHGEYTYDDILGTFVHEFGHLIHTYYSMSENVKQNINAWFKHFKSPEILTEMFSKNLFLLFKQFDETAPSYSETAQCHVIVYKLRDYFYRKFNNINTDAEFDQHFIEHSNRMYWRFVYTTLTAVPSWYGREDFKLREGENKDLYLSQEWFAEGFAFWYLTPPERRNKIWQWWHELFTQVFTSL